MKTNLIKSFFCILKGLTFFLLLRLYEFLCFPFIRIFIMISRYLQTNSVEIFLQITFIYKKDKFVYHHKAR